MDLAYLLKRRTTTAAAARRGELAHPEYPIEQTVRGRDNATKAELARFALRRTIDLHGAMLAADDHGVRVLARCEATLSGAVAPLTKLFAQRIALRPPAVRYVPGNPVLEPYMFVLASGPQRYLPLVRKDMSRRGGRFVHGVERGDTFRLEAEAPLAQLLGYGSWLAELTQQEQPQASAWLSRYLPVDDDGPRAA